MAKQRANKSNGNGANLGFEAKLWLNADKLRKQPTIGRIVDDAMVAIERDNPRLNPAIPEEAWATIKRYLQVRFERRLNP